MVEMNETASILHNLSDCSLVLLDEIGRGTSTYDGISIAWAIAEFLHGTSGAAPRPLPHYHESTAWRTASRASTTPMSACANKMGKWSFSASWCPGQRDSFGIHVAKLAGMPGALSAPRRSSKVWSPKEVAAEKLCQDCHTDRSGGWTPDELLPARRPCAAGHQRRPIGMDIDQLTPVEALLKLHEIRKRPEAEPHRRRPTTGASL